MGAGPNPPGWAVIGGTGGIGGILVLAVIATHPAARPAQRHLMTPTSREALLSGTVAS